MARLHERYNKEIAPRLAEKLNRRNRHSLPRLEKIVVNMGVGKALQDKNRMKEAADHLGQITGQRPQITKAKVAVSRKLLIRTYIMLRDEIDYAEFQRRAVAARPAPSAHGH